jgi:hypothetical protein
MFFGLFGHPLFFIISIQTIKNRLPCELYGDLISRP